MLTNKEMVKTLREERVSLIEGKSSLVLATRRSAWTVGGPENLFDTLPYDMLIMLYPEILLISDDLVKDLRCFNIWSSTYCRVDKGWLR